LIIFIGYKGGCSKFINKPDYRERLSKNIDNEITNGEITSRSKDGLMGVFKRNRKLPLRNLIVLIMSFNSALQRDLDRFFKSLNKEDFSIREVTKGALSQARAKLNPLAFQRLNKVAVDTFYEQAECYLWHGKRLLSVDGTRLLLPSHHTVKEEFGVHKFGPKADSERSMAIASILYDVLNQVSIDAQIAPYSSSEGDLLHKHLDNVYSHDLLLLDRGYPSLSLFFLLKAKGVEFCVRMKDDWWISVNEFAQSGENQRIVTFKLPKKDWKKLKDYPQWQEKEITCRLIKVLLPTGEYEILCTSLTDMEQYPCEEFEELYHYRWNEEEAYKLLKCRIELEDFSGKTAIAVKQDFHAKVFLMSLCAVYAHPIEDKVRQEYKADQQRKHDQKINRTNAIAMTRDILISVFIRKEVKKALVAFDDVVKKTREIIRPGRSVARNHKQKKPYNMIYKRV
jgi:hypothetical protein